MIRLGFVIEGIDKTKDLLKQTSDRHKQFVKDVAKRNQSVTQKTIGAGIAKPTTGTTGISGVAESKTQINIDKDQIKKFNDQLDSSFFRPIKNKFDKTMTHMQSTMKRSSGGIGKGGGISKIGGMMEGAGSAGGMMGKFGGMMSNPYMAVATIVGGAAVMMGNELGKQFEELQKQQIEYSRLIGGGGIRTGYKQYGIKASEAAQMDLSLTKYGGNLKQGKQTAELSALLNLNPETASIIQAGAGQQKATELTGYFRGAGANRVEAQSGMQKIGEILKGSIESGFRVSADKLAGGVSSIYGMTVGGQRISAARAERITTGLNEGFQNASNLQGGLKQSAMFQAIYQQMSAEAQKKGEKVSLVDIMKRAEQGATGENIQALQKYSKERFGTGEAGILAMKELFGLSTSEAEAITTGKGQIPTAKKAGAYAQVQTPAVLQREVQREESLVRNGENLAALRNTVETKVISMMEHISGSLNVMAGLTEKMLTFMEK